MDLSYGRGSGDPTYPRDATESIQLVVDVLDVNPPVRQVHRSIPQGGAFRARHLA